MDWQSSFPGSGTTLPLLNDAHLRCAPLDAINSIPDCQRTGCSRASNFPFREGQPFLRASQPFRFGRSPRIFPKKSRCHQKQAINTHLPTSSPHGHSAGKVVGNREFYRSKRLSSTRNPDSEPSRIKDFRHPCLHPCVCSQREKQKYIGRPNSLKG